MCQLVLSGDDGAVAKGVVLGPARPAEDLQHVEDAQVRELPLLHVVYLCALL